MISSSTIIIDSHYIFVFLWLFFLLADHHVATGQLDQKDDKQSVTPLRKVLLPPPLQNPRSTVNAVENPVWLHLYKYTLTHADLSTLLTSGSPLNDKHVNLAQTILKKQFPKVSGLQSTLLQFKVLDKKYSSGIQIVHCPNDHFQGEFFSQCNLCV